MELGQDAPVGDVRNAPGRGLDLASTLEYISHAVRVNGANRDTALDADRHVELLIKAGDPGQILGIQGHVLERRRFIFSSTALQHVGELEGVVAISHV